MNEIIVGCSEGQIKVNKETGKICGYSNSRIKTQYSFIDRFNLKEYKETLGFLPDICDILDLGYWGKDGKYEIPDENYREMMDEKRESFRNENKE